MSPRRRFETFSKRNSPPRTPRKAGPRLAAKLFEQGTKTADDPVARYVLWRLASAEAAGAGEIATAFEYVDHSEQLYQVDALSTKADLLAAAAKALRRDCRQLGRPALGRYRGKLVDAALQDDKFEVAARFLMSAGIVGEKTRDSDLNHEVIARTHEVDRQRVKYAAVQKARQRCKRTPRTRTPIWRSASGSASSRETGTRDCRI